MLRVVTVTILLLLSFVGSARADDKATVGRITALVAPTDRVRLTGLSERGSGVIKIRNMCSCTLIIEGTVGNSTVYTEIANPPDMSGGDGTYAFNAAGYSNIQVRASAFTSGAADIEIGISNAGGGTGGSSGGGGGSGDFTIASHNAAFGTAGSADTQVRTVQGIANMTPLLVGDGTGAFNVIVDSGTITAVTTITNPVTVTDGSGALNIICDSGCSGGTTDTDDASIATGQSVGLTGALNMMYNSSAWVRMVGDATNGLDVDVTRLPSLVAGNANIGDVDVATIAAGDNNIGNVDIVTMPVAVLQDQDTEDDSIAFGQTIPIVANLNYCSDGASFVRCPVAAGGAGNMGSTVTRVVTSTDDTNLGPCTPDPYIAAGSGSNEHEIKATAGRLCGFYAWNISEAAAYLRCPNATAASTTPGTTAPIIEMMIPSATDLPGGFTGFIPQSATFSTALTCIIVTEAARTGTTAVAANEAGYTAFYK